MEHQPERGDPGHRPRHVVPQDREVRNEAGTLTGVCLVPLGSASPRTVEELASPVAEQIGLPVYVRARQLDLTPFHDRARGQYNSTAILLSLKLLDLQPGVKYLAVVFEDLFIPILTYVFGEAELGGPVAIVSYERLQNERYGLAPDPGLLHERLLRESLHELGHTFGLIHCASQECVMHTATYVEDIDMRGGTYCTPCRRQIRAAVRH